MSLPTESRVALRSASLCEKLSNFLSIFARLIYLWYADNDADDDDEDEDNDDDDGGSDSS